MNWFPVCIAAVAFVALAGCVVASWRGLSRTQRIEMAVVLLWALLVGLGALRNKLAAVAIAACVLSLVAMLMPLSDNWRWPNLNRRNRRLVKWPLRLAFVFCWLLMVHSLPFGYRFNDVTQVALMTLPSVWIFWRMNYEMVLRGKWRHFIPPSTAPGWYPDLSNVGWLRWWDGRQWTVHVSPIPYRPSLR